MLSSQRSPYAYSASYRFLPDTLHRPPRHSLRSFCCPKQQNRLESLAQCYKRDLDRSNMQRRYLLPSHKDRAETGVFPLQGKCKIHLVVEELDASWGMQSVAQV